MRLAFAAHNENPLSFTLDRLDLETDYGTELGANVLGKRTLSLVDVAGFDAHHIELSCPTRTGHVW